MKRSGEIGTVWISAQGDRAFYSKIERCR